MTVRGCDRQVAQFRTKNDTTKRCPECPGRLRTTSGETVCSNCGLVVDEYRIDHAGTRRTFPDDETNTNRTGAPLSPARHDRGLSTEIGSTAGTSGLSGRKRSQLRRLRREHRRGRHRSKAERNQMHGFIEIRRLVSGLALSAAVRDRACTLFRSAQNRDLLHGRCLESVAAASVYAACRCLGIPRTLAEVESLVDDDVNVRNGYSVLTLELDFAATPFVPADFVPRYASLLDVEPSVRRRALSLAERALETGVAGGRRPTSFAASCLYVAAVEAGHRVTQTAVAEVAETTPQTIRRHRDVLSDLVA